MKVVKTDDKREFSLKAVDEQLAQHFARHAEALLALKHPFIVTPKACYRNGDGFFLLRPYSEGTPLRIEIQELKNNSGLQKIQRLIAQLVAGIEYLHSRNFLCM